MSVKRLDTEAASDAHDGSEEPHIILDNFKVKRLY